MHQEYRAFFRLLGLIARYGCDGSASDAEGDADLFRRGVQFSVPDFLSSIYEPRGVEDFLVQSIRRNPNLLCLVGGQGAGKTSLGYKVRSVIAERHPSCFIVFIDARLESASGSLSVDESTLASSLRQRLEADYLQRLFPLRRDDPHPRIALWAFLLDSNIPKPLALFSRFTPLQDRATALLRRYDASHQTPEQHITLTEWLTKTYSQGDADATQLAEAVDALIEFTHLAFAAETVLGKSKQILWLDNIDALPDQVQSQAIEAVKSIYLPVSKLLSMVVAIREENIFREFDLADEGAPPYETRILLEMPRNSEDYAYFPAHDVPVASDAVITAIVRRRLEATRAYQLAAVAQIASELALLRAELVDGLPPERAEFLREQIADAEEDLANLKPVISEARYRQVESAASKLLGAMRHERAIYVTNNSLRNLLFMFRDTLADMFKADEDPTGVSGATRYTEWHAATLFLRNARNTPRRYQVGMYDVIAAVEEHSQGAAAHVNCLLPYLVITTTWNLSLKSLDSQNRYGTPRVTEVITELARLGYAPEEVRRTLHELYFRNNTRQNLIEFRSRDVLRTPSDILDDMVVYVTFRGKCIVSRTGSSFGYLYDCLMHLRSEAPQVDILSVRQLTTQTIDDVLRDLLPYFCDMADMHYRSLRAIRDKELLGTSHWLEKYYATYGMPHVAPYGRKSPGGRTIRGIPRTLLLEGTLNGLLRFVPAQSTQRDALIKLSNAFTSAINNLATEPNPTVPSFRVMLGVRSRKSH